MEFLDLLNTRNVHELSSSASSTSQAQHHRTFGNEAIINRVPSPVPSTKLEQLYGFIHSSIEEVLPAVLVQGRFIWICSLSIIFLCTFFIWRPHYSLNHNCDFGELWFWRDVILASCDFGELWFWRVVILASCDFGESWGRVFYTIKK